VEENKISVEIKIVNIAPTGDHKRMAKPHITKKYSGRKKPRR